MDLAENNLCHQENIDVQACQCDDLCQIFVAVWCWVCLLVENYFYKDITNIYDPDTA